MAWFSAVKKGGDRVGVIGFLRRVVAVTMGCFFGCFGMKDSHSRLKSTPEKERLVSRDRNALSSLFLPDDSENDLFRRTEEGWGPVSEEIDIRELKDEAKFLKACGTLLETPVEIRKVSSKWVGKSTHSEELNSLITSAFIDKLRLKEPLDETSTPVKSSGEWVTGAGFLVGTPNSSMPTENNTRRDSISSSQSSDNHVTLTPEPVPDNETHCSAVCATTVQRTNKSVRFELHPDSAGFSSESSAQRIKLSESGSSSASMPSPYPTPLHLTDEMQTPGTVFPAYGNNIAGVTTKIRSQYVYSVLNPIQYHSQWKELDEEHSDSNQQRESPNPNDEATMMSTPMSDTVMDNLSVKNDKKDELSLSQWLKPQTANENVGENVHFGRTPGDRPILGMVAAHWNEASHISPKWCGGNGIPNSTTKYKEDQKVSWHATPFEERLEKALSEDNFISQRKQIVGVPAVVEFDECEESDTASSQLQSSSSHLKSIVSF